ncbi:MAG: AAA family ATPase [Herpetosiphonaceae bacterium]|nr:AAA family ATPase [Herpetosiphonaceae bacterium]
MIIFINGPFGVGKTTTAYLLASRLHQAMVYDPEIIGTCVRHLVSSVEQAADYQDHLLWRILTVEVARLVQVSDGGSLIVPMTITRPDYYTSIMDGFRRVDPDLVCVCLMASPDTLHARILASSDVRAVAWRLDHIQQGLTALHDPLFGTAIPTDDRSPTEVADIIMSLLLPSSLNPHIHSR